MVMQPAAVFLVNGLNPRRMNTAPPPPPTVGRRGFELPNVNLASAVLPFNQLLCDSDMLPHCLEPSERKLLTPPNPPPPVISSFRG